MLRSEKVEGGRKKRPRAADESQSTERNPRRSTQRRAQCSGNELQEVAQASGEDLALHPMDTEAGRNPTTDTFSSQTELLISVRLPENDFFSIDYLDPSEVQKWLDFWITCDFMKL